MVTLTNNEIKHSSFVAIAIYGSDVVYGGNEIACHGTDADILGIDFNGFLPTLGTQPGNECTEECPAPLGIRPLNLRECQTTTIGISPPPPVTP